MIRPASHSYQFGHFRLEPDARLLLLDGQPVTLTPKAFDTLLVLVRQPGRVITREELMQEVWPDTFVEEANLTVNISTLRKALGEHSTQHRYIVTVPGRGYRFVAEVKEVWEEGTSGIAREQAAEKKPEEAETVRATETQSEFPAALRRFRANRLVWLLVLVAAVLLIVWRFNTSSNRPIAPLRIVPITSFPGQKSQPAFSPDGNQVAFVWDGGNGGNQDIYVKLIDAGTPLRLTSDVAAESDPVWSADGKHLAFLRPLEGSRSAIFLIPALGGSERKVAEVSPSSLWQNLDWSADGKYLAVSDKGAANENQGIFLISVESGEKQRLTTPPPNLSDGLPKFSPDGKTLAFVRGSSLFVNDLYLVSVAGGEARRLTTDQRWLFGQAWTADGRALVFSSNRGGLFSLWRISTTGGAVEALPAAGDDALYPAISRQGNRLSYVRWKIDSNIWRVAGPTATAAEAEAPPVKLIASTREDAEPQISPDGKRIAFHSNRTGSYEIWVCDSDGKNPIQLTHFKGPQGGSPRWSPDGRQIAFDCRLDGPADIFVINVDGGAPRRLTTESSEDIVPSWSRDGRWVYFSSNRSGKQQVWKIPAEGGTAQQVTQQGGFVSFESTDGHVLYYHKRGGIWRMPVEGGEETRVLDQVEWGYWAVTEQGICFLNRQALPRPAIELFNFAMGQIKRITTVEPDLGVPPPGFAVSPDGRWLLYKRVDQSDNDIMLVENFR